MNFFLLRNGGIFVGPNGSIIKDIVTMNGAIWLAKLEVQVGTKILWTTWHWFDYSCAHRAKAENS